MILHCHYYKYQRTSEAITLGNLEISPPRWPFPNAFIFFSTLHRNKLSSYSLQTQHGVQDEPVPFSRSRPYSGIHEKKGPKIAFTAGCGLYSSRDRKGREASLTASSGSTGYVMIPVYRPARHDNSTRSSPLQDPHCIERHPHLTSRPDGMIRLYRFPAFFLSVSATSPDCPHVPPVRFYAPYLLPPLPVPDTHFRSPGKTLYPRSERMISASSEFSASTDSNNSPCHHLSRASNSSTTYPRCSPHIRRKRVNVQATLINKGRFVTDPNGSSSLTSYPNPPHRGNRCYGDFCCSRCSGTPRLFFRTVARPPVCQYL